ncbi:FadR/GntR family transcriptional regulator [Sulfobacillus harzensis]|uniref:FadR family transcriptional regulator n=1 Tax=Sulfobacillus harzensis TaxID=2729629 RepID=A0A7Y0L2V0_9FIRM|nr:FadR/GntR family transcriptional regulator [Sulfobacillus harzensis]NMP21716.1 FadR family transcriptional regulator [Sulfobacillus harzensis]
MRRREQILHSLGCRIVSGDLPPGTVLPKVETVGVMEGVSRTVVREALKGLEARGMVASVPKGGTTVRPRSEWQWWNREVLGWAMETSDGPEFYRQLTEVRLGLEPMASALAAQHSTPADHDAMRFAFERMASALDDDVSWAQADYDFHRTLIEAAHNDLMTSLMSVLRDSLVQSRKATMAVLRKAEGQTSRQTVLGYHHQVLATVIQHDIDGARAAMTELLEAVERLALHTPPRPRGSHRRRP